MLKWTCLWFQVIPEILTHSFLNGRFLALGLFVKRALTVFVPKLLMNRKTALLMSRSNVVKSIHMNT